MSDSLHRQTGRGQPYQACLAIADSDTVALCIHRPLCGGPGNAETPPGGGTAAQGQGLCL